MFVTRIALILGLLGFVACAKNDSLSIEGKLSVKGTSIHTYLNIKDIHTQKNYKIQNNNSFDLMNKQNQTIHIEATLIQASKVSTFPSLIKVVKIY